MWIFQILGRSPCIVGLALLSTSYYAPLHKEKNVAIQPCLVWRPIIPMVLYFKRLLTFNHNATVLWMHIFYMTHNYVCVFFCCFITIFVLYGSWLFPLVAFGVILYIIQMNPAHHIFFSQLPRGYIQQCNLSIVFTLHSISFFVDWAYYAIFPIGR